jgi:predicted ATPase
MTSARDRFFVVTGGPGSGKSTLLAALAARGLACAEEAGRSVIRDQVAIGGTALPWADRHAFAELMLSFDMRAYRWAEGQRGVVVFDRGIPDVLGYLRLCGLPMPTHVQRAAELFRYNARVFIAPPWREIFAQDAERKQTLEEAERTHDALVETYTGLGYKLTSLPLVGVEQRAHFVLQSIDLLVGAPGSCR